GGGGKGDVLAIGADGGPVFGAEGIGAAAEVAIAGGEGAVLVVLGIHDGGLADLAEVGEALDGVGLIAGFVEGGEENRYKDGDDCDDDKELDESKGIGELRIANWNLKNGLRWHGNYFTFEVEKGATGGGVEKSGRTRNSGN